ncbi:TlpA family protein disulfide reductase [Candidatus Kaiserbacteria bacterium]|nr:TlpA family protein disulfide reductase [Candidatus Kaiserbacteria bacterium]
MEDKKFNFWFLSIIVIVLIAVTLVAYLTYTNARKAPTSEADKVLTALDPTNFVDQSGQEVDFTEFKEKVRVINSWATWSPHSRTELVLLNEVASVYKDKGVLVFAINRNEPSGRIEAYLKTLPELANIRFVQDMTDELYGSLSGYAMPETVFYDEEGNLIFHKRGVLSKEEVVKYIEEALAGTD